MCVCIYIYICVCVCVCVCISLLNIFFKFLDNFPMNTEIYGAASQILFQWTSHFVTVQHTMYVQLTTEVSHKNIISKRNREFLLTVFM